MDQQLPLKLRWEFLDPDRQRPHASGKVVVVEHTPQTSGDVLDLGHLIWIDTDCWPGWLAYRLEVGEGDLLQANERGEVRISKCGVDASTPCSRKAEKGVQEFG